MVFLVVFVTPTGRPTGGCVLGPDPDGVKGALENYITHGIVKGKLGRHRSRFLVVENLLHKVGGHFTAIGGDFFQGVDVDLNQFDDMEKPAEIVKVVGDRNPTNEVTSSKLEVFPGEVLADLILKVAAALGIPPWRFHVPQQNTCHAYRIRTSTEDVDFNIFRSHEASQVVNGIPLDDQMQEDNVRITAQDWLIGIDEIGGEAETVCMVDIFWNPEQKRALATTDKYLMKTYYQQYVQKFWPRLSSLDMFRAAMHGGLESDNETVTLAKRQNLISKLMQRKDARPGKYTLRHATYTLGEGPPQSAEAIIMAMQTDERIPLVIASARAIFPALAGAGTGDRNVLERSSPEVLAAWGKEVVLKPKTGEVEWVHRHPEGGKHTHYTYDRRGRLIAEAGWSDVDKMTLDGAREYHQEEAKLVRNLFRNELGVLINTVHEPPRDIRVGYTISVKLTKSGFQTLKQKLRVLEMAGYAETSALQQGSSVVIRMFVSRSTGAYSQMPGGRTPSSVTLFHRTNDVYFEISAKDDETLQRIQGLLGLLFIKHSENQTTQLTQQSDSRFASILALPLEMVENENGDDDDNHTMVQKLRREDPDLFDMRKFKSNAPLYSVLCQGPKQPIIYSKEEAAKMSKKDLVEYYNFTKQTKAYYRCPNPEYPHLSLKAGIHPKGYCLPCCNKKVPRSEKRTEEERGCRLLAGERRRDEVEEGAVGTTRHILAFGKVIPPGRLCYVPKLMQLNVLSGTCDERYVYRLLGVQRGATNNASFLVAVAAAYMKPVVQLSTELAASVDLLPDTYWLGYPEGFKTRLKAELTTHAGSYIMWDVFYRAVTMLVRWRYSTEVIVLESEVEGIEQEVEDVRFVLTSEVRAVLATALRDLKAGRQPQGFREQAVDMMVVYRLHKDQEEHYSIMVMINESEFLKSPKGAGPARRLFSSAYQTVDIPDTLFRKFVGIIDRIPVTSVDGGCSYAKALEYASREGLSITKVVEGGQGSKMNPDLSQVPPAYVVAVVVNGVRVAVVAEAPTVDDTPVWTGAPPLLPEIQPLLTLLAEMEPDIRVYTPVVHGEQSTLVGIRHGGVFHPVVMHTDQGNSNRDTHPSGQGFPQVKKKLIPSKTVETTTANPVEVLGTLGLYIDAGKENARLYTYACLRSALMLRLGNSCKMMKKFVTLLADHRTKSIPDAIDAIVKGFAGTNAERAAKETAILLVPLERKLALHQFKQLLTRNLAIKVADYYTLRELDTTARIEKLKEIVAVNVRIGPAGPLPHLFNPRTDVLEITQESYDEMLEILAADIVNPWLEPLTYESVVTRRDEFRLAPTEVLRVVQ